MHTAAIEKLLREQNAKLDQLIADQRISERIAENSSKLDLLIEQSKGVTQEEVDTLANQLKQQTDNIIKDVSDNQPK